jgi:hypothetical protein
MIRWTLGNFLCTLAILDFRAITLAGEQERKLLKEVVKKATLPVKSRVIPSGTVYLP